MNLERLEPNLFGEMGALDSERLKHPNRSPSEFEFGTFDASYFSERLEPSVQRDWGTLKWSLLPFLKLKKGKQNIGSILHHDNSGTLAVSNCSYIRLGDSQLL